MQAIELAAPTAFAFRGGIDFGSDSCRGEQKYEKIPEHSVLSVVVVVEDLLRDGLKESDLVRNPYETRPLIIWSAGPIEIGQLLEMEMATSNSF